MQKIDIDYSRINSSRFIYKFYLQNQSNDRLIGEEATEIHVTLIERRYRQFDRKGKERQERRGVERWTLSGNDEI